MTPSEFKFWFEGFTESIDKQPTQKQWARIKARVEEINGTSIVYVDRYRPYWIPGPYPYLTFCANGAGGSITNSMSLSAGNNAASASMQNMTVDVEATMRAIGRDDAAKVAA